MSVKGGAMLPLVREILGAYGSFFSLGLLAANLLLLGCTLLQPNIGALGLVAGLSTLSARHLLGLTAQRGALEALNGILAGLYVGSLFSPGWYSFGLAVLAGPLTILIGAGLTDRLVGRYRLPLLSATFVVVGAALFALGRALALPYADAPQSMIPEGWLPAGMDAALHMLGGIYFNPTAEGGLLVLAALALSSRCLVLVAAVAYAVAVALLWAGGVPVGEPAGLAAASTAVLTAIMVGGIFANPGARALAMAALGAACATVLSLAVGNVLWYMALPPLSAPFLVTTWLIMVALRPERGGMWPFYWLAIPALPEHTAERRRLSDMRGLSPLSVALRMPVYGRWEIYQGFGGAHTHCGPWQYALDFFQVVDGQSFRRDGARLDDFHCFGAAVCSPVFGTVAACRCDLVDNVPGDVDVINNWGNFILIALATGEYVLLAHLQQGSVAVWPGCPVVPGQAIALCGNSGRSPQPHLHVHVQTGMDLGSPTRPFHLAGALVKGDGGWQWSLNAVPGEQHSVAVTTPNPLLRRALHWSIGRTFTFELQGRRNGRQSRRIQVDLDQQGGFWLRSDRQAMVGFIETPELLALFERKGPADPFLDAFTLALGLTPFIVDRASWRDAPPLRLLPVPLWLRGLCWLVPTLALGESHYDRVWDNDAAQWRQSASHSCRLAGMELWSCTTLAIVSEADGVASVSLSVGEDVRLQASLAGIGLRSDNGVTGWERLLGILA